MVEHLVHQLIHLGHLEFHITLKNVFSLLVYPYFELGIEQDAMHKPLLIKQEIE